MGHAGDGGRDRLERQDIRQARRHAAWRAEQRAVAWAPDTATEARPHPLPGYQLAASRLRGTEQQLDLDLAGLEADSGVAKPTWASHDPSLFVGPRR